MSFTHGWWGFMIGIITLNSQARVREQQIRKSYTAHALKLLASQEFRKVYSNPQMEWRFNR